ncbi:hypothetical protein HYS54_04890 [Candidatus Micrarchaeota archaeon]|nr:hypothetical protein [Candidatus Micrarchaeota archaeon]
MYRYLELWAILARWRRTFSLQEFSLFFPSAHPRKVLHDLVGLGFLRRVSRGEYSPAKAEDLLKQDYSGKISHAYECLKEAMLPYSLTGVDAVSKWTCGGYDSGRFFGFYPIYIRVNKRDLARWKRFSRGRGFKFVVHGEKLKGTLFGILLVFVPVGSLGRPSVLKGEPVDSLAETIWFAEVNAATFERALPLLRRIRHGHQA